MALWLHCRPVWFTAQLISALLRLQKLQIYSPAHVLSVHNVAVQTILLYRQAVWRRVIIQRNHLRPWKFDLDYVEMEIACPTETQSENVCSSSFVIVVVIIIINSPTAMWQFTFS